MKVTKEKVENCQVFLTVEMEPAEMEEGMEHAYQTLVQRVEIPGFRKGKAPRAVVERTLGRGRLLEEAIDHILPQAYEQALKEHAIEPYAQPELEITQAEPLIFRVVVPLTPSVTLGDYHSLRMSPETAEVKDENIEAVLQELRHQHATWEPVERPLDYNDLAVMDIDSHLEDRPYYRKLGAQIQITRDMVTPAPNFGDYLIGMKKGEEKEFDITLPDDYPLKSAAGKPVHFKIKLHEIKEEKLPELNDEFAARISTEIKTLDALREEVVKNLRAHAEENARIAFEEKLINAVIDQCRVEYPPMLVEMELDRLIDEQARRIERSGQNLEYYLQSLNKTMDQYREELRPIAVRNIVASLVLSRIAAEEKVQVTEADVDTAMNNMGSGFAEDRREEVRKLVDTPQNRQSIFHSLRVRKTIERLKEIAQSNGEVKVKEKEEG
ncbi:MAG: trigger factor [Dehalococcoidales bacterium]|nr:trigger factor [Dehalococcoidales bacterium]